MALPRRTPKDSSDGSKSGSVRLGVRRGAVAGGKAGQAAGRGAAGRTAGKGGKAGGQTGPAKAPKPPRGTRLKQVKQVFALTRASDPRMLPLVLAALLVPLVLLVVIGLLVHHPVYLGLLGLLVGLVAATAVFGRRAQRSTYSQVEGQLGAGAMILQSMRGDWRVTPAVGVTREQDMLHRVLGRPGVVLVAEGAPGRTRALLIAEKKRLARVVGDTPVYDVVVGDGEGQVALRALEKHFVRLPRNIKPSQVNVLDGRLKALGSAALPIPKGPMPKGNRVPRGKAR